MLLAILYHSHIFVIENNNKNLISFPKHVILIYLILIFCGTNYH